MPALKSILSFVVLGFVLEPATALALDECLSKPNASAPKGQHWYYRVDRANNNRQCWRLGPEGLRIQKSNSQIQKSKSQGAVQPDKVGRFSRRRRVGEVTHTQELRDLATATRRAQRAKTMGDLLKSVITGVLVAIFGTMILDQVGVNIAPIIASAGIIGIALGFGAQSLVKDFLSGVFMIFEDQYGVGDVIDVG